MRKTTINFGGQFIDIPQVDKRMLGYLATGLIILIILVTSLYTIDADAVGVIQRFGKYVRTTDPGLHLKMTGGIDTVKKVKVQRVFKEELGLRTV